MRVDEAGRDDQPGRVERLPGVLVDLADGHDAAVAHADVALPSQCPRPVDEGGAADRMVEHRADASRALTERQEPVCANMRPSRGGAGLVSIIPDGRLVYGMQLQVQSQSAMYAEGWEADAGAGALAAIARKADETGFFYVAVCDHVAIPKPIDERMRTTWYDTVATLGWL